tara:strand:- start:56 stop:1468 length:1413 start_codon:yes stop_codon:yes gene_type:complete
MKLFDTLTSKVKCLDPAQDTFRVYSCGPTVYSEAHIGNFRSFITADLIVRNLRSQNYGVRFVSNITDVGHLTNDDIADANGQDKLTKAFTEQKSFSSIYDLARHYTHNFIEAWDGLNLVEPDVRPRATEHIPQIINLISSLIEKGFAYKTKKGVYFSVKSFNHYGQLSGNIDSESLSGVRNVLGDPEKKDPRDFALWKIDPEHLMRWHSPFGIGYPGWHVECSAMLHQYLGSEVDIHTGGEDNKFPHHECEIAQSESAFDAPLAKIWVHTSHLLVNGEKMSKSMGNFYTVSDVLKDGTSKMALRYALMNGRYREPLNFTNNGLNAARKRTSKLERIWKRLEKPHKILHPFVKKQIAKNTESIGEACHSDLNIPLAIFHMNAGIDLIEKNTDKDDNSLEIQLWIKTVRDCLGFDFSNTYIDRNVSFEKSEISSSMILDVRASLRHKGDFENADKLRDVLIGMGLDAIDTKI